MEPKEEPLDNFPSIPAENETSNQSDVLVKEPKEEPLEPIHPFPEENEIPQLSFMEEKVFKEEETLGDGMIANNTPTELKEEPIDNSQSMNIAQMPVQFSLHSWMPSIYPFSSPFSDNSMNYFSAIPNLALSSPIQPKEVGSRTSYVQPTSIFPPQVCQWAISQPTNAIRVPKSPLPQPQKRKSSDEESPQPESVIKKAKAARINDTELECPECEYRSRNVNSWETHLRKIYSTNSSLAGLALRCECGHESLSHMHALTCKIGMVTVIRKSDGPIRRFEDPKLTPQCILCEVHPKTPCGYVLHLRIHHKTTLTARGVYLLCECATRVTCADSLRNHNKECDGRLFTLHKLNNQLMTPHCVLCEKHPKNIGAYSNHLKDCHKSSLKANGIYLTCACDFKVTSQKVLLKHSKECDGSQFTVHKLQD